MKPFLDEDVAVIRQYTKAITHYPDNYRAERFLASEGSFIKLFFTVKRDPY